jgi:hypothetical protein
MVLYINGKATTTEAITVAYQVKITLILNRANNRPIGPCLPNKSNKTNPITVGGSTKGAVSNPSIKLFPTPRYLNIQRAVVIPQKEAISVAVKAVFKEIHTGERSRCIIISAFYFLPVVDHCPSYN